MGEKNLIEFRDEEGYEASDWCPFDIYGVTSDNVRVRLKSAETHGDALWLVDMERAKHGKRFKRYLIEEWV